MRKIFCGIYPRPRKKGISYYDLFPPIGLEYIGTIAKEFVDEVILIDMRYERQPVDRFIQKADVIGISINWHYQRENGFEIIKTIPAGKLVIVGGIDATENVEEYFKASPRIDIIVRGDGEEIIKEILSGRPLENIRGISYLKNGKIFHNESAQQPKIIDLYPDRSLRRYDYKYRTFFGIEFGFDVVVSSRGCPYKCLYCSHKLNPLGMPRSWSARSPESVVEEIRSLEAEIILFSDDNFGVDFKRVERICDLIIAHKIRKIFAAEVRIEIARQVSILEKMWVACFRILDMGIESPSDITLEKMQKGFTTKQVREAFENFKKYPMVYIANFIIGYFDQEKEEMLKTANFARELGTDFIAINHLRVHGKYSPLFKILEERSEYKLTQDGKIYSDKYSMETLFQIKKIIKKKFYSPSQIARIILKLFKSRLIFRDAIFKLTLSLMINIISRKLVFKGGYLK